MTSACHHAPMIVVLGRWALGLTVALGIAFTSVPSAAARVKLLDPSGPQPEVISPSGRSRVLYDESHALLISVSEYEGAARGGWSRLPNTAWELDDVAEALRPHGFSVRRVYDPTGDELISELRRFVAQHGQKRNVRLLVFFSGHGYTNASNDFGYLVPVDAKDPQKNSFEFYSKALPIQQIDLLAREVLSKHALFLFDSCFSGSIFSMKSAGARPESIGANPTDRWQFLQGKSQDPVRQFIAAGSATEALPGRSSFVPLLVRALRYGTPSQADGYLTGKGLGLWIEESLPGLTGGRQNPQSGVIRDPALAFGDMVFQIPTVAEPASISPAKAPPDQQRAPLNPAQAAVLMPIIGNTVPNRESNSMKQAGERRHAGVAQQDASIEATAARRVQERLGQQVHVNLKSYNRFVLITGEANSEDTRKAVETIVERTGDVVRLLNDVVVEPNSSIASRANDAVIASRVKAVLADARDLTASAFQIMVERGVVYLMGRVTEREASRATDISRMVVGVAKVVRAFELVDEEELARVASQVNGNR